MENVLSAIRLSMDYDHKGEWNKAHEILQNVKGELACRIYAYLHRKEGDMDNALVWYRYTGVETLLWNKKIFYSA